MVDFLAGYCFGYVVAHYAPARLSALFAKFKALLGLAP